MQTWVGGGARRASVRALQTSVESACTACMYDVVQTAVTGAPLKAGRSIAKENLSCPTEWFLYAYTHIKSLKISTSMFTFCQKMLDYADS